MATTNDAPALPAEFADIGRPEQVYDLSAAKLSGNRMQMAIGCAVAALSAFGMATPTIICGISPFGKNAPPPAACFGVGGFLAAVGLAFVYGVYHFLHVARVGAGAFHIFRDWLVVVRPGQPVRKIAWEQIGPEKPASTFDPRHVYPVEGEADLEFDTGSADHAVLAQQIAEKSSLARWTEILTPAGVASLGSGQPAPAFLVYDPDETCVYRVSPIAGHLLFVRVGAGSAAGTRGIPLRQASVNGGLAGAAAGWAKMKEIERLQETLDALENCGERRLFEQAAGLGGSRLIGPEDLADLRFDKLNAWEKLSSGVGAVAVLKFRHPEWGQKKMYSESLAQLTEASRVIQSVVGRDFSRQALQAASV